MQQMLLLNGGWFGVTIDTSANARASEHFKGHIFEKVTNIASRESGIFSRKTAVRHSFHLLLKSGVTHFWSNRTKHCPTGLFLANAQQPCSCGSQWIFLPPADGRRPWANKSPLGRCLDQDQTPMIVAIQITFVHKLFGKPTGLWQRGDSIQQSEYSEVLKHHLSVSHSWRPCCPCFISPYCRAFSGRTRGRNPPRRRRSPCPPVSSPSSSRNWNFNANIVIFAPSW